MIHNISRFIAALALLATAQGAWAQTPSGNWDTWVSENNIDWSSAEAKAAAIPQSDDGSTVYISTAEQLAYYAYAVNNDKQISGSASGFYCGRTVELIADIDLSAHYWKPIGINNQFYFNGYFHGNGHVITGMHVNGDPQSDNAQQNFPGYGLFGYLHTRSGGTSTITDLVLKDFSVTASYSGNRSDEFYLGGLVGRCDDNTAITNCLLVNGSVSKVSYNNYAHIGKVAGGGSPSTATANYYHNVSVSGWDSDDDHYAQQTIGGETEARAVALTISGTHGNVAFGGTVGRISGGIIYAPANETVTLNTTTDAGYIASLAATGLTLTSGQFTMPDNDDGTITATISIDPAHFSQSGDTYTIHTATGWGVFCDLIADGESFSGKTVRLDADIAVSRMAGSGDNPFCGNFDGGSNTLTFTADAADNYCAPFVGVKGGTTADDATTISNLNVVTTITANDYRHMAGLIALQWGHVNVSGCNATVNISSTVGTSNPHNLYPAALVSQASSSDGGTLAVSGCTTSGTISTDGKYAAGLVGIVQGTATITDCISSVTIDSSTSGDGTHGGIVAVVNGSGTITGCVFNGKLLSKNTGNDATTNCAGFVAWGNGTISNCLYAPANIDTEHGETEVLTGDVNNYPSGTFYRGTAPTVSNCYYTRTLGTAQGKATRTVTAADDVTIEAVALTGTATQYTVSGITAYSGGGLQLGQTLYYGSGDQLSLTLSNSATGAPLGYRYDGYTASAGTLSGSTLTMPDQDVTISVNTAALAPIDWATVNEGDSEDPYMIYNKDQLLLLAHRVNGTNGETAVENGYQYKYFKLGADITFTHPDNEGDDYDENYEAIGTYIGGTMRYFKGKFDGANHTVSGIRIRKTVSSTADIYQGLFGCIDSGADIYDVHLTDARITGYENVGGIVGYNFVGNIMRCSVTDSYITATDNRYYGTICGSTTNTIRLRNNYYHGCTVNSTAVTSGMGCNGADITAKNGALPAYAITLGANITTPPGTFLGDGESFATPPDGARLAPGNGFTLAGNHYFASGYEFTPGSTLASGAAQGYTPRATLGDQLLDLYTPTGDNDPLAGTAIAQFTVNADCDGKTLNAAIRSDGLQHEVSYTEADGTTQTAQAVALDGHEAVDEDGDVCLAAGTYYVGTDIAYANRIWPAGDVTLILVDGKTMTLASNKKGIYGGYNLTIYGQSLDADDAGTLRYDGTSDGITADNYVQHSGNVSITTTGSSVFGIDAKVTLRGGTLTITANGDDALAIFGYTHSILGGQLTATGSNATGIRASDDAGTVLTLGWTRPADFITVSSIRTDDDGGTVAVKDGQALCYADGDNKVVLSGTLTSEQITALAGKTLQPCLALADAADNTAAIDDHAGQTLAVALSGRTLYKDGSWNTLCLPFDISTASGPLSGNNVQAMTLNTSSSSLADGTLTLNFDDAKGETIPAGTPFIIKWDNTGVNITNPVFMGVTVSNATNDATVKDVLTFTGTYAPVTIPATGDNTKLYLGAANKLYYPSKTMTIGTHRAYFQLADGITAGEPASLVRAFALNFGDDESTGITEAEANSSLFTLHSSLQDWYTLDGRRLDGQPTAKGLYIHGGKKVIVK